MQQLEKWSQPASYHVHGTPCLNLPTSPYLTFLASIKHIFKTNVEELMLAQRGKLDLPPYRMPLMFHSVCQSCPRDHSASLPFLTSAQLFHAIEKQEVR